MIEDVDINSSTALDNSTDLVRLSRAGDAFHYRWAARRCLHLVNPGVSLKLITIEGSSPAEKALGGEYVIDVAEYHQDSDSRNESRISYIQLKHSIRSVDTPFTLSDLQTTIEGFADRYKAILKDIAPPQIFNFTIVTNRPVSGRLKNNFKKLIEGSKTDKRFKTTLESYTKLKGQGLINFSFLLNFEDGEGDYIDQKSDLHCELSELLAGTVEHAQIDTVIALVAERALPNTDGRIIREDILKRLGADSERDLFPAPPKFDPLGDAIKREQHEELLNSIIEADSPIIIHAEGGVGKSVVCRQLASSLPSGSKGIVYDCFGAGKYRSRSEPRHRHRDALVQISNELAEIGLCESLIPRNSDQDDALLRAFLSRVSTAINLLRRQYKDSVLAIFLDAADNAEMAADEFSEPCFVHQLMREDLPDGVKLVSLCRTERIYLLQPQSSVVKLNLLPFSLEETCSHINGYFHDITNEDATEFLRLTGGNPRVQANALSMGGECMPKVLTGLGPDPTTIDDQIKAQLGLAVSKLKEVLPKSHQKQIDSICLGLANLPPFIPINVLAEAANVEQASVKSFVSDLGRPLWMSEDSVQFRDEPTETWFREQFSATKDQVNNFICNIKRLSKNIPYVSEAIPALLLKAERYEELVKLALSDELLPEDSPIDARNIKVYRLQFAFKAALKSNKFADASKLAMRAGEEVAGDRRQYELLKNNIDLVAPLQSEQRVQELAYRRILGGAWQGSENAYSAALLSSVPGFKGEARSYLRSADNWLHLYFDERDKRHADDGSHHSDKLETEEIVELAYSHYKLFGEIELIRYVMGWRPPEVISKVSSALIRKLVDASEFESIERIAKILSPEKDLVRYQYFCLSLTKELWKVGKTPAPKFLRTCLDSLLQEDRLPEEKDNFGNKLGVPEIVSFAESCLFKGISKRKTKKLLNKYINKDPNYSVWSEFSHNERYEYLRGISLDSVLTGKSSIELKSLIPKERRKDEKNQFNSQELRQFEETIGGMLPWHMLRAKVIAGKIKDLTEELQTVSKLSSSARNHRYRDQDTIPFEISRIRFEILALHSKPPRSVISEFIGLISSDNGKYWLVDKINALRICSRGDYAQEIIDALETNCYRLIKSSKDDGPVERADLYIQLARAVIAKNILDARAYFDHAIEAVSKFGDEMTDRWEAIASIANRYSEKGENDPKMAYRFIRCAELVGEHVAREKYIDRNGAVNICAKISPNTALASISRWRDRDIGWFDEQLPALIKQSAKMKYLSPKVAWAFTGFSGCDIDVSLIRRCIENEVDKNKKQNMLQASTRDLLLSGGMHENLKSLNKTAAQFNLKDKQLEGAVNYFSSIPENTTKSSRFRETISDGGDNKPEKDWDKLLEGLELVSTEDIEEAIKRFDQIKGPRSPEEFWKHIYRKIDAQKAYYFLQNLVYVVSADRFDVQNALEYFPLAWREKAGIRRIFPQVIRAISRRFADEYTNYWAAKNFSESVNGDEELISNIQEGIVEGLSDLSQFIGASAYFGFARFATSFITPDEAYDVVNYSLLRFEEHIEDDFGDGPWDDWLVSSEVNTNAVTGLIWSALGSPRSSVRWDAAHCVRRLANMECADEIDALIEWMDRGVVEAFGCKDYPFYYLHAKQYLLIALARVAIDNPSLLEKRKDTFRNIALCGVQHVLIQKIASEVALLIETSRPGCYDSLTVDNLKNVSRSQFPEVTIDGYAQEQPIPQVFEEEAEQDLDMYFSWDFDRYWYDSLGRVFGVSSKKVQKIARQIVVNEWKVIPIEKFIDDPRSNIWRTRHYERETSHSHGSYPDTDDYSFYISYHGMLSVAQRLLESMPVVDRGYDFDDERWESWLKGHSLTRDDGKWLSDRREPPPLEQREWLTQERSESWRWEILAEDFMEGLLRERKGETWLIVDGYWNQCDDSRDEDYRISSALVSPETSLSLLNALTTCRHPSDYKLPDYMEDRMEIDKFQFELKGWVDDCEAEKRLDNHDPRSGDIGYPPQKIGKEIVDLMELEVDFDKGFWCVQSNRETPVLKCDLWGNKNNDDRESFVSRGRRLCGTLSFLTNMCERLNKDLIIEVQLSRSLSKFYNRNEDDDIRYLKPYSKVYILSKNGVIRDTTTSYTLRKETS